jgi:beta-mannosidase
MQSCFRSVLVSVLLGFGGLVWASESATPVSGWVVQDAGKVDGAGEQLSLPIYHPGHWYPAVVPGTVLTSLVRAGVYPEPLYGENNRTIPEKLAHDSYWYRTSFRLSPRRVGEHDWLRFNGINYLAEVYVNGRDLGPIKGAFVRGVFDLTSIAPSGSLVGVAVHLYPAPHPGKVYEQTVANGTGPNGGAMGQDGPTFVATVGWDWMPGIRDRNTGLWQGVETFRTGEVRIEDPYVSTDFPNPDHERASIGGAATLQNLSSHRVAGTLSGEVEGTAVRFQTVVNLGPNEKRIVDFPIQVMDHPRLWWPNGYGQPNLYHLKLHFAVPQEGLGSESDTSRTQFGVKSYSYFLPGSKNLTVIVNGVPIFCKGGNWGLDEAMKRIPYDRLEAQIRMHRDAHCTMIRNWVGQCTEEDFYDLCDKYGIMVWDDFWLANPADGPIPNDNALFMRNAREKVLRFRNHPSIAVWCGRNEASPPPILDKGLGALIAELDGRRFYQPHSAAINGVGGGGPYAMRPVGFYFNAADGIHTEIGLPSIPTLESIQGMMPKKDWSPNWRTLNDDWAEHDLVKGAQDGTRYPRNVAARYGTISNLADFVRKSQMANYEGYRAVFEGRNSKLFNPATGVLLWMSSPAQPSFVWQLYSYDLEPNSALFGTEKGCEPIHIQYDPVSSSVEVVNNTGQPLSKVRASVAVYGVDGKSLVNRSSILDVAASSVRSALSLKPSDLSAKIQFLKLELRDTNGALLSDNFYWEPSNDSPNRLVDLQDLPVAGLSFSTRMLTAPAGVTRFEVTIRNPGNHVALMTHLQLRRGYSGLRVLPVFYSDNYVSLLPGETRKITVEARSSDFAREPIQLAVDGWNVKVGNVSVGSVSVVDNSAMKPGPVVPTPLPVPNPPGVLLSLICGNDDLQGTPFVSDESYVRGGNGITQPGDIDVSSAGDKAAPKALYPSERYGEMSYRLPVPPLAAGEHYVLRLHFLELSQRRAGDRRFNVDINGKRVLTEFDIFAESGGMGKLLIKDFVVDALTSRNTINVTFTKGSANEPEVRAIQVLKG